MATDVQLNRAARKWSFREQRGRVLWALVSPIFRLSPRIFWGWRRMLLRLFGAKVGADAHVYPTVRISMPWNIRIGAQAAIGDRATLYALGPIQIGERVTISQYAHLCAGSHDYRDAAMPLLKLPIEIGPDAWVCADAFVGPGVVVGSRAIVAARAVAVSDVPDDAIVAGNPARFIKPRITVV